MIDTVNNATIQGTSLQGYSSSLSGLDLMSSIQLLLVKDYDDQLRGMAKQIKGSGMVKEAYRKEIEELHKLLGGKTNDKGDKIEMKGLDKTELADLKSEMTYQVDSSKDKLEIESSKKSDAFEIGSKTIKEKGKVVGYWVNKSGLESKLEAYKSKLDSLNEQSELTSLGVQTLTNQRKIAFETISNLVNKQHDSVATMVRNIKG